MWQRLLWNINVASDREIVPGEGKFCKLWRSEVQARSVEAEEVALEHLADPEEHLAVDAFPVEDFVNVRAVAIKFVCQPNHSPFLGAEFIFYDSADVDLVHRIVGVIDCVRKSGAARLTYSLPEAPPSALSTK